jgi:hypothetical protein
MKSLEYDISDNLWYEKKLNWSKKKLEWMLLVDEYRWCLVL